MDINEPSRVLYITEIPVLGLGNLGCFDDSGVMTSWIVDHGCMKYLFYTGWTQGVTVPYYFYVGLAISKDRGKSYERISKAPMENMRKFSLSLNHLITLDYRILIISMHQHQHFMDLSL